MNENTSKQLTDEQSRIVLQSFQTMSVFAAPGSGKTTVLTEHILFQLRQSLLQPAEVMAVTFTKQAAKEMASRLASNWKEPNRVRLEAVHIGTFHSQMFGLLLAKNPNIPVLLDPAEQFQMMKTALQLQSLPDSVQHVHKALMRSSKLKSQWPVKNDQNKQNRRLLQEYETLKSRSHRWDFDDILVHACLLFDNEAADSPQLPVRYILVDEFQDTNDIQWEILTRMVKSLDAKLFVVGDDDQSIYGFRGANPAWLVDFKRWYPESLSFTLTVNFRSDREIIRTAASLIEHNQRRRSKTIVGHSSQKGIVQTVIWESEEQEAASVARWIKENVNSGTLAVLARTRKQLEQTWSLLPKRCQQVVEFRTFHDAKGKEWDTVHIVGAVKLNPYLSENPTSVADLEEERRLFYVAITRARHSLYIHSPTRVQRNKTRPSVFITECAFQKV
ncbi:ATP-dependent helicase [Alicyclobacillus sp. SO9]|uniref:ATP-dependent helicase n=1 Tax=Alicyclobacillus sp. SO9 TaxID=2665646 RepID=UPI0018E7EDEB|nr:UvrD-helicase domain-containing protein [Alicyclobacillus sp. SO9]